MAKGDSNDDFADVDIPEDLPVLQPKTIQRGLENKPVGRLGDSKGKKFLLQGVDQDGCVVEWVVKPTGDRTVELTVPDTHELGTPDAWTGISIATQLVVSRGTAESCACDGTQCGCNTSQCGSNAFTLSTRLKLLPGPEAGFALGELPRVKASYSLHGSRRASLRRRLAGSSSTNMLVSLSYLT